MWPRPRGNESISPALPAIPLPAGASPFLCLSRSLGEALGPPDVRPLKNYPLKGRTRVSSELSIPHRSRILCVSLETQPNSIALDALRFASDDWKQTDSPSGERSRLRRGHDRSGRAING